MSVCWENTRRRGSFNTRLRGWTPTGAKVVICACRLAICARKLAICAGSYRYTWCERDYHDLSDFTSAATVLTVADRSCWTGSDCRPSPSGIIDETTGRCIPGAVRSTRLRCAQRFAPVLGGLVGLWDWRQRKDLQRRQFTHRPLQARHPGAPTVLWPWYPTIPGCSDDPGRLIQSALVCPVVSRQCRGPT
jgi:hypothetical protein